MLVVLHQNIQNVFHCPATSGYAVGCNSGNSLQEGGVGNDEKSDRVPKAVGNAES